MKLKAVKHVQNNADEAASLLKALSNPERLLILCYLVEGEQSAGELWKQSNLSQSAFSQHLSVLRKQGIVKTRKEAQTVFYSLADEKATKFLQLMHELYC